MQLFVGLGNPGAEHARQRHNIGFMALDAIAEAHGFGPWRAKFQGKVAEGRLGTDKVFLLKPETYMNRSGQSVGEAARFYKLGADDITVFHDELDLAPGKLRVKRGGGHAGHNGLRSIHPVIGEGYQRVRLGIGHPGDKAKVAGYVLHDFSKAEQGWLEPLMRALADAAPKLAEGDGGGFMNAVALETGGGKPTPKPKPGAGAPADPDEPSGPAANGDTNGATPAKSPFDALKGLLGR